MGWKNVKTEYRIKHIVTVENNGIICIGSPYIHNIIEIDHLGQICKGSDEIRGSNEDLRRYIREFTADPDKLVRMIQQPDTFDQQLPVYTYHNGRVVKEYCEVYDWPNVTTGGKEMYTNTYFQNKRDAYKALLSNTRLNYQKHHFENIWRHLKDIGRQIGFVTKHCWHWALARTIERITLWMK